ncbi:MAG: hypothetical protein D8M57_10610 [Candidatus Scalindua sp. AMX11]|nr:MAG: hypothetical protein DWQ00_03395 [Candidatus Scalindua sp.]NOG83144.1 hypothetical protein [Planctomycetota bacterium]RZV75843.1 MAG: hypothetical protein EX341_12390 [Candidatus Scalindua sp. SCAELEC01]TDE64900.1 MAG: hypothetical protein D8M57_10610 [Candidatus Scalindua sp. AMX11]GJQ60368.1 MAG: hypothetical protein SCALA701_31690 [Candidatus Scalindua sp.]
MNMNVGIAKEGEWFVGNSGSEFSDGVQMASATQKCESMIGPGLTTAIEQLVYLQTSKRTNHSSYALEQLVRCTGIITKLK